MWFIQYIEAANDEQHAKSMIDGLRQQSDFRGARILPPVNQEGKNMWRVQAFFTDATTPGTTWLPDGCRRVMVLPSQFASMGIQS